MHDGVEYPLDVLIYATGFQWMATSTFNMITGRGGQTLKRKWETEGTKTFLGLHSHGFPNLFIVCRSARRRRQFQFHRCDRDARRLRGVDARRRCASAATASSTSGRNRKTRTRNTVVTMDIATAPLRDCITYYNGEGTAEPGSLAYYGGNRWHKYRVEAQTTLAPYVFEGAR